MFSWFRKKEQTTENDKSKIQDSSDIIDSVEKEHTIVKNDSLEGQFQASDITSSTSTSSKLISSTSNPLSWFGKGKGSDSTGDDVIESDSVKEVKDQSYEEERLKENDSETTVDYLTPYLKDVLIKEKDQDFDPDPKVVEFFEDLPEYYRNIAVKKYSSRKGLLRFDWYRDEQMRKTMKDFLRGRYPEDPSEKEYLRRLKYEQNIETSIQEKKQQCEEKGIPKWEQFLLQYVPLQDGEDMSTKLVQTAFISCVGLLFLEAGVLVKKRFPKTPKDWIFMYGIYGLTVCTGFQAVAWCRLKDLYYFDNSVDRRPFSEKITDDLEKELEKTLNYWFPPKS